MSYGGGQGEKKVVTGNMSYGGGQGEKKVGTGNMSYIGKGWEGCYQTPGPQNLVEVTFF